MRSASPGVTEAMVYLFYTDSARDAEQGHRGDYGELGGFTAQSGREFFTRKAEDSQEPSGATEAKDQKILSPRRKIRSRAAGQRETMEPWCVRSRGSARR